MGTKRIGLARLEAMLEALDRDLDLTNATLTAPTITNAVASTFASTVGIAGALTRLTPETLFRWNYIDCGSPVFSHAQSSDTATATEHKSPMAWPGTNGEVYLTDLTRLGAVTAAVETPLVEGTVPATDTETTAAGLNMQMDQDTAADLGWELNFGSPMGGGTAFTVGTHAGFIDMTVFCASWGDYDAVSIGFRKAEPVNDGHAPIIGAGTGDPVYSDFATFGVHEPDLLQIATDLNNGGTGVYTNTAVVPADSENQRFRVTVSSAGVVTYTRVSDQPANSGTMVAAANAVAYTFDSGDVIIPYVFIHGRTHADTALLIKHLEIERTPGSSYEN